LTDTSKTAKLMKKVIQLLHCGSDTRLSILAPLALDPHVVHAPASEAYTERVFTVRVCGDLTTASTRNRNRTSKTLDRRVFLKMNKKTLDELTSTAYTLQDLDYSCLFVGQWRTQHFALHYND